MTKRVESSIDARVPASAAYEQWARFEECPRFMRHVERVRWRSGRRMLWRAKIGGRIAEWEAEVVERVPDRRIAWRCTSGPRHAGLVTFRRLAENKCRVELRLEYDVEVFGPSHGDHRGLRQEDLEDDLRSFANFVEARQSSRRRG